MIERMNLREQTQLHPDHLVDGISGDCWATSVACLLEVPREEVPHFVEEYPEEGLDWWHATQEWVASVRPGWALSVLDLPVDGRMICTGKSPRGEFHHCVVVDGMTGEMLWDPHPSRAGVLTQAEYVGLVQVGPDMLG